MSALSLAPMAHAGPAFHDHAMTRGPSRVQMLVGPGRELARVASALLKKPSDHVAKVGQMA